MNCCDARNACMRVLFLTARSTQDGLLDAIELGATDDLLKPIDQEQLPALISRAYSRQLRCGGRSPKHGARKGNPRRRLAADARVFHPPPATAVVNQAPLRKHVLAAAACRQPAAAMLAKEQRTNTTFHDAPGLECARAEKKLLEPLARTRNALSFRAPNEMMSRRRLPELVVTSATPRFR